MKDKTVGSRNDNDAWGDIPVINKKIIDAVNSDSLVIFVGAGVSTLSGMHLYCDFSFKPAMCLFI